MDITRIKLARVGGYASEDTGDIINDKHPSIMLQLKDNIEIVFPFTSDEKYAIKDKNGNPDSKFYTTEKLYANTRIRSFEECVEAKNYYLDKGDFRTANDLHIGSKCYHLIEKHNSYLEANAPVFRDENNIKVSKMEYYTKYQRNEFAEAEIKKNRDFFSKGLKAIEYGMILGKFSHYESSSKPIDYPFENKLTKFKMSERVDIAFAVNDKKRDIDDVERISKIEYVENLRHMKCFSPIERLQLVRLELNLKIDSVENKQEKTVEKYGQILESKKQAVFEGNLEKYKEIKEEIASIVEVIKAGSMKREELQADIREISDKIDNLEKEEEFEKDTEKDTEKDENEDKADDKEEYDDSSEDNEK